MTLSGLFKGLAVSFFADALYQEHKKSKIADLKKELRNNEREMRADFERYRASVDGDQEKVDRFLAKIYRKMLELFDKDYADSSFERIFGESPAKFAGSDDV
jgi:molecular chaperone GrpE (heat shock protein)